jgi:hypothetical protein
MEGTCVFMGMQVNTQNFDKLFKLYEIAISVCLLRVKIYPYLYTNNCSLSWLERVNFHPIVM